MPKRPSVYHRPQTLTDALALLSQPDTVPLSGGTKLLARDITSAVVDIQALGLDRITWDEEGMRAGAAVKLTDLALALSSRPDESGPAQLLRRAIHLAGPNTYRNAATIGGIVASRVPSSELLATLLVLDAGVTLYAPEADNVSLVEYLASPDRRHGLITEVAFAWVKGMGAGERVARTPADTPIVSVTLWQPANGLSRLAATGISERPIRLADAEHALRDGITPTSIGDAAAAAREASVHPGDFLGDAAYRAEMASVLTRRVCEAIGRS